MPKMCKYAVKTCCGQPPLCNIEPGRIRCNGNPETCDILRRVEQMKKQKQLNKEYKDKP